MTRFRLGPKSLVSLSIGLMMIVQGVPAPLLESAGSDPSLIGGVADGAPIRTRAIDDWPQFHNDPSRTGATASPAPSANTTIWTYSTGAAVNSSPAVDGTVVFIGSADGNLYSFNASTGELLWKAATGGKVCSSPAVWGAYVYVGSEDGDLHCYYKDNGTERFSYPAGAPVRAPVLVVSSSVVFGTDNGTIVALTLDGAFAWSNQTPYPVRKAPAAAGGIVLAVSGPALFAFNLSDGSPRWNASFGPGNLSHPSIGGGQLFVGSEDGWVRAFNVSTGNPAWAGPAAVTGAVACSPAYFGGFLYLGTRGQRFYRLDASNGSIVFNISADGPVESSAAVSGPTVLFGTAAGLSAVNNGTGALMWNLSVAGGVTSSPAISRGRCYFGSAAGAVVALGERHTARITFAGPPSARQGEDVGFNGTSSDCVPLAYQWSSDLDGILSTKNRFNITTLTLGTHRISLRIQDDTWTWSAPETATIEVSPSAEWPMFKKDSSHRGLSEGEAPLTKTVVWNAYVGGQILSSPAVYQGMVFVGTRLNGAIYALDINTGATKWSYKDSYGNIVSSPACADGMVFVCDDYGNTIAFDADPSDGIDEGIQDLGGTNSDIIWLHKSSPIWGSPVVAAGKVIVPAKGNATIYALDEFTGVPAWKFSLPDPNNSSIWCTPAVEGGLVLFGSSNHHFYALDLGTGREVWNFTAGREIRESSACVQDGIVYFGSWDRKLYALNLNNGTQKWYSTTGDMIDSSPSVANGRVLFGSSDFTFRALDAETGQEIWTCSTGGAVDSSPAVGGGLVFFAARDGRIYALNESTGKTFWTYERSAGQSLKSSPALVDGRLYIGLENGTVLAFGKAPDIYVPSPEITLSPVRPAAGQQVNVSARVYNIGSLDASAMVRITEGPAGSEIFSGNKMVPAGGFVDVSGNWTVGPGVHHLVVQATDTVPYEANLDNNIGSMEYSPPPRPGWSMFKYGPERTSARDLTTPNSNKLAWTCETRDIGFSSPVTAGNRLYQASGSMLLAFDIDVSGNGVLVWSHTAGGTIRSTPAVSNIVVFGSSDGNITALNEWDGSVVWKYSTGGEVVSSPLIQSDTVYVGSSDGYLYSIGLFDQRLQWKKYLGGPVESSPAYHPVDEMLVVGCQYGAGGRIYCLYTNGTEVWNLTMAAPVASSPAVRGGMAWVGCDDGFLYALDVVPDGRDDGIPDPTNSTTDIVWMTNLSSYVDGDDARVRSSPAILEGSIYVGAGRDAVVALNSSTGKVIWHRNIGPLGGKYMFSSPAVSPGRLFIGGPGLFSLNTRNGATVWSYVPGSWVWSSPAISLEAGSSFKGMVFAVTEDGRLCAFSSTVNIPPVARISSPSPADVRTYRVGEIIQFNASESWDPDGEIVNWTWDLGDGNTVEGESVVHNYTDAGDYTINLTVKDDRGLEAKAIVNIGVRPNSAPRLGAPSVSRDEGTVNDNFTFTVTYFDADNDSAVYVRAYAGDQCVTLVPVDSKDTNTTDGKAYYSDTRLLSGLIPVYFECYDGVLNFSTPVVANLTVTNRTRFGDPDRLSVELYYAGRGEVLINISAFPNDADAGQKKISNEFEIKTNNIDIWWWANISWNISSYNQSGINRNTIRIYKYNPSTNTTNKWVPGENPGLDLETNWTWANVTSFSNFAVMAQLPPNHRPVARLGKDITIMEGETVFFNASASSDEDNDSLEYNWTFGDSPGKAPVKGDNTAEHKYNKPGRYTVTVYVSDGRLTSNATQEVIVKQKGGEQFVIVIVVIIILVVAIIFILPRGEEKGAPRRRDEEEFKKGMEVRAKKDNTGKKGGKKGSGPPDKAEEE